MIPHHINQLPVVILLAAGRGERFIASGGRGSKLDALLSGKRVLDHTFDAVKASGLPYYLVVADVTRPGMGDSIAAGVRACADAPGWLILPGDLPLVTPATLRAVAAASGTQVVVPRFKQQPGHPVLFPARCGAALRALCGAKGAAAVLHEQVLAGTVSYLDLDDTGIVTDIDTTQDLELARQLMQR